MADASSNNEQSHGKHGKGRKKAGGNPRIDMTPMVDLAFLLLTFFVLTSNLNTPKVMQMTVPVDGIPMPIDQQFASTILIDGNKDGKVYVYHGRLNNLPAKGLAEYTLNGKNGIRQYMLDQNKEIAAKMKYVRSVYKSGKLDQISYDKLKSILAENARPEPNPAYRDTILEKRKREDYSVTMTRLDKDLIKHALSDTTFRSIGSNIRNNSEAPFFVIKWGNAAKYSDVINVLDELKITDNSKYAVTKINSEELQKLSEKTGVIYPELSQPLPAEPINNLK